TSADLKITKDDGVTAVTAGDGVTYTYTITVKNLGDPKAKRLTASHIFPAYVSECTITPSQGTFTTGTGGDFTAALGTITAGDSAPITVTFTVPSSTLPGSQTNTVTFINDTSDPLHLHTFPTRRSSDLTSADLKITKDDGVTAVTAGDGVTYTYTITVKNL